MATMLTPELSEEALESFRTALGPEAVLTDEDELREFRDPVRLPRPGRTTRRRPCCMPTTVEEIQAIVRIANEHKVPLWTHGAGMNNGYGGPGAAR